MRNKAYLVFVIGIFLFAGCQRNVILPEPPVESITQKPPDLSRNPDRLLQRTSDLIEDFGSAAGPQVRSVLFAEAAGLVLLPALADSVYTASGDRGAGVLLTRGRGQWGLPVFVSVAGSSLSDQIGAGNTDVLLVFRKRETISTLQKEGSIALNGLPSALGPIGPSADLSFIRGADIVAYKRTGGQFVGFYVSGGVLSLNPEMTLAYYTEPQRGSIRGYYAVRGYHEDEAERLVNALMNREERIPSEGLPRNAGEVRSNLEGMSNSR